MAADQILPLRSLADIAAMLQADPLRWRLLGHVRDAGPPGGWIGAGFVRNAVWDRLHGRAASFAEGDVDVIWHDPSRMPESVDTVWQQALVDCDPAIDWSVKNQARMHMRNGDRPYASVADAVRYWPETATAIAARRTNADGCELIAPYGIDDLTNLVLRPTPGFVDAKRATFDARVRSKRWLERWPGLRVETIGS